VESVSARRLGRMHNSVLVAAKYVNVPTTPRKSHLGNHLYADLALACNFVKLNVTVQVCSQKE
jgi:hypothetical protein